MDQFVAQVFSAVISFGPGGVLALIAIGWGWTERKDRKEAQDKLEKALTDWKADTLQQSDRLAAIVEKASALADQRRGTR